jgi:hypothetical protein
MSESLRERLRRILTGKPTMTTGAAKPVGKSSAAQQASGVPLHVPPFVAVEESSAPLPMPAGHRMYPLPARLRVIDPDLARSPADFDAARDFLAGLRAKMAALAEDFAMGKINRQQFETIYVHYREQRQMVEALLNSMSNTTWRKAVSAGETALLMKRTAAQVLSYALYDNSSSLLLASTGQFKIDPVIVVPMLSAYRAATAEIFGAGISSSEIEGGRWLSFVSGRYTTFIVLYSLEPSRAQLNLLEDLHRDFEIANVKLLSQGKGQQPAEHFMKLWALEETL